MAKRNFKSMHLSFPEDLHDKIVAFAERENRPYKNAVETILLNHFKTEDTL